MEKELEKRRSWPWKKKNGINGMLPDGGASPTPVKLFDEQEVSRILQDQVRIGDEALHETEEHYAAKEKALNGKLTSALAEITIKDNLVKQHIKVAEEAVIGWEKAENESAAFKSQLDVALQQKLATEDRVKHLDGALKEVMKQLRNGREEQEQRIHETIVKKTREYDKLRAEMESKLDEASEFLAHTRTDLIESRAENKALTHALQERTRAVAELSEAMARAETDINVLEGQLAEMETQIINLKCELQVLIKELELIWRLPEIVVRLEGLEKENFDLKYESRIVTKELEMRISESEFERRASEGLTKQHAESVKKIAKLEDECNRLRILVRKKLPSPAAMVRMKQEVDALSREAGETKPRRRLLNRTQSGTDHLLQETTQENVQESSPVGASHETDVFVERIVNMDEETKMLKEALAKRIDELQAARIMCAKTASRLSTVEEELEMLKSGPRSASNVEASPDTWADATVAVLESSRKEKVSRRESLNFELMDDFIEMERLANSQSRSQSGADSEITMETASVNGLEAPASHLQQQNLGLEDTLATKDRALESANQLCQELRTKFSTTEEQLSLLQTRNAANEECVISLQERLDRLLETQEEEPKGRTSISDAESKASTVHSDLIVAISKVVRIVEALAQATGCEFCPSTSGQADSMSSTFLVSMSMRWSDVQLNSSMSALVRVANKFLQSEIDMVEFMLELGSALDCVMALGAFGTLRKEIDSLRNETKSVVDERPPTPEISESAKGQICYLEEELRLIRAERGRLESHLLLESGRFSGIEAESKHLRTEKAEVEQKLQDMKHQLSEATEKIQSLKEELNEAEIVVADLRRMKAAHDSEDKEDELIEEELMELSSANPGLALSIRAADAEMNHLHDKVAALEVELHGERRRHHEVVAKLEDLQEQIHRGVGRSEQSGSLQGRELEWSQLSMSEDNATKLARKEREIAAAALAECQRTILALGKQLKVLGVREPADLALTTTDSPDSIQKMTETMEFLRWQTETVSDTEQTPSAGPTVTGTDIPWSSTGSRPNRVAHPGLFYRQGNNGLTKVRSLTSGDKPEGSFSVPASPSQSDFSVQDPPSVPSSPSTVLRSVRTMRASPPPKCVNNAVEAVSNEDGSLSELPQNTSTVSRFYSRSQSETSMSTSLSMQ